MKLANNSYQQREGKPPVISAGGGGPAHTLGVLYLVKHMSSIVIVNSHWLGMCVRRWTLITALLGIFINCRDIHKLPHLSLALDKNQEEHHTFACLLLLALFFGRNLPLQIAINGPILEVSLGKRHACLCLIILSNI